MRQNSVNSTVSLQIRKLIFPSSNLGPNLEVYLTEGRVSYLANFSLLLLLFVCLWCKWINAVRHLECGFQSHNDTFEFDLREASCAWNKDKNWKNSWLTNSIDLYITCFRSSAGKSRHCNNSLPFWIYRKPQKPCVGLLNTLMNFVTSWSFRNNRLCLTW